MLTTRTLPQALKFEFWKLSDRHSVRKVFSERFNCLWQRIFELVFILFWDILIIMHLLSYIKACCWLVVFFLCYLWSPSSCHLVRINSESCQICCKFCTSCNSSLLPVTNLTNSSACPATLNDDPRKDTFWSSGYFIRLYYLTTQNL